MRLAAWEFSKGCLGLPVFIGEGERKQVGDDDADKFGLPIGEDTGDFIFLIIEIDESLRDDLLIFKSKGIRIIEIP